MPQMIIKNRKKCILEKRLDKETKNEFDHKGGVLQQYDALKAL